MADDPATTAADRILAAVSRLAGQPVEADDLLVDVMALDSLMLAELMLTCELAAGPGSDMSWMVATEPDSLSVRVISERASIARTTASPVRSVIDELATLVRLRPIHESDIPWLRELTQSVEHAHRFVFRGHVGPPHRFIDQLVGDAPASFVAETPDGTRGIGYASIIAMDLSAGHATLGFVIHPAAQGTSLVSSTFLALCRYAVRTFGISKVFLQVPDFNIDLDSIARSERLRHEARLDDYYFHDGRLWGVNFFSLSQPELARLTIRRATDAPP